MTPSQRKRLVRNHSKSDLNHRFKLITLLGRDNFDLHDMMCSMDCNSAYEFRKRWGYEDWRKVKRMNRLTSTSNMQ